MTVVIVTAVVVTAVMTVVILVIVRAVLVTAVITVVIVITLSYLELELRSSKVSASRSDTRLIGKKVVIPTSSKEAHWLGGDNKASTQSSFTHVTTNTWAHSEVFGFFRKFF